MVTKEQEGLKNKVPVYMTPEELEIFEKFKEQNEKKVPVQVRIPESQKAGWLDFIDNCNKIKSLKQLVTTAVEDFIEHNKFTNTASIVKSFQNNNWKYYQRLNNKLRKYEEKFQKDEKYAVKGELLQSISNRVLDINIDLNSIRDELILIR